MPISFLKAYYRKENMLRIYFIYNNNIRRHDKNVNVVNKTRAFFKNSCSLHTVYSMHVYTYLILTFYTWFLFIKCLVLNLHKHFNA